MKFYAMCKNRTPITLEAASLEEAKEKFEQWEPMEPITEEKE